MSIDQFFALLDIERASNLEGTPPADRSVFCESEKLFLSSEQAISDVLNRIRTVCVVINALSRKPWPPLEEWKAQLPEEFSNKFRDEYSPREVEELRRQYASLNVYERMMLSDTGPWTLSAWIYWMQPERRRWFLLETEAFLPNFGSVLLGLSDSSCPLSAFKQLCIACGAKSAD